MKRVTLLISLAILATASALAIPAKRGTVTHTQSDGTVISFEVFGDEFNNYTLAEGLYTIVQDESGDYCYALSKNGGMVSSGVKVRPYSRLTNEEKRIAQQSMGVRKTAFNPYFNNTMHSPEMEMMRRAEQLKAAAANEAALRIADWGGEVKGKRNLLVILVEYSDVKFSLDNVQQRFHNLLNQDGYSDNGATGSAKDYFSDSSNKKFVPTFDVVGPYTLPQTRSYYGGNNAQGDDMNPAIQAQDACNLADSDVDFSKYDYDKDGDIDLVFILYAGHNPAEGGPASAVWPHQWDIYPGINIFDKSYPRYDNKNFVKYACTSELRGSNGKNMTNIGTFCHEFGHALGLPDWYDVDYGGTFGMDYASIMNSGSYLNESATPPLHNALERWLLGWTLPKDLNAAGNYEMEHISKDDSYIMWANSKQTECFLFEARTKAANCPWDYYLNNGDEERNFQGGEGMLVYHVDWSGDSYNKWVNHTINTNPKHACAYIFRANPNAESSASRGWFFPGSSNATALSYDNIPQFKNWGGERMALELENIAIYNDKIVFDVVSKDFEISARQYDAMLDWRASAEESSTWIVKYVDKQSGEEFTYETTNKYFVISPLQCDSRYHAQIFKASNTDEPLYEAEIHTQSNVLTPRPSMMLSSEYKKNADIRLSVKNLDCVPSNIVWYVDKQKTDELLLQFKTSGQHHICAAITDEQGNNSYIYRYITIK